MKKLLPIFLLLLNSRLFASQYIREDTATQVTLKFVDSTDGVTAETALTITTFDCNLVKHANSGMASTAITVTASGGSNDAAHLADGIYSLELTATDTSTPGRLDLYCQCAGAAPFEAHYVVVPQVTYDQIMTADYASVADIVAGVMTEPVPGSFTAGQAGFEIGAQSFTGGVTRIGTAQAGAAGSITLDTGASSVDDFYNQKRIVIMSGTGAGQSAIIADYVGSTRVASTFCEGTTDGSWRTNPSSSSIFVILPRNKQ
jgi:hypothetical protein